jgi:hypothetical protein
MDLLAGMSLSLFLLGVGGCLAIICFTRYSRVKEIVAMVFVGVLALGVLGILTLGLLSALK